MPTDNGTLHIFFLVFIVLFAVAVVVIVTTVIRNIGKARRAGLDPLTMQTDLAARVMNSDLLAAQKPLAQKLADVDALLARGEITAEEHSTARAAILAQS
jgi:uncharacterized membrane protein